jgi:hypothetical protein
MSPHTPMPVSILSQSLQKSRKQRDRIHREGTWWSHSAIFKVLSRLLPELMMIGSKTDQHQNRVAFLLFDLLLDWSLLERVNRRLICRCRSEC